MSAPTPGRTTRRREARDRRQIQADPERAISIPNGLADDIPSERISDEIRRAKDARRTT